MRILRSSAGEKIISMKQSIPSQKSNSILSELGVANKSFQKVYPGDRPERQPVHTVYGGANLFKLDMSKWPALTDYATRIAARPAVKEAMKAEGLIK